MLSKINLNCSVKTNGSIERGCRENYSKYRIVGVLPQINQLTSQWVALCLIIMLSTTVSEQLYNFPIAR